MAKGKSKKAARAKEPQSASPGETPVRKAFVPKGLRKQIRRLERLLSDAARKESTRLRKLERIRNRRQKLQAAVEELRHHAADASPVPVSSPEKPPAKPAGAQRTSGSAGSAESGAAPVPKASPRVAATRPSPRPRPAARTAKTAPKPASPATPAPKPAPSTPDKPVA